jgi:hypothetical protein
MDEYKAWLEEAGVKLPEHRLERLAGRVARELEQRIGNVITDQLTDEQLAEFEDVFIEAQKKQAAWLEKHYPDYEKVVEREMKKMYKELTTAKSAALIVKHWR